MHEKQPQKTGDDPPDRPEAYGVPQPPDIEKQWTFSTLQKLGIPVLILLPVLALLGLFGASSATTSGTGSAYAVEVTYPSRLRYQMLKPLAVSIENRSSQAIPTTTVSFDQDYISQFSSVSFTPEVSAVTGEAYYVQLDDLQPGERRLVVLEVQAENYWRHDGQVAVIPGAVGETPDVAVEVSTLIYP